MILAIDHRIFGNGYGMASPHCDARFYWLSGEMYSFTPGFGAQLMSIQWTHPKAGEERILAGRKFRPLHSRRRWCRVVVSWAMVGLPHDIDAVNAELRKLENDLGKVI